MFFVIAMTIISDALLILCLTKLINYSLCNLTNPSNFYFDTMISKDLQKPHTDRYLAILKKNLDGSIHMLHKEKYINNIQKDVLLTKLYLFVNEISDRLNNEINNSHRCLLCVNMIQDINKGAHMICAEINCMFYKNNYDVRLMSITDETGFSFKLYSFNKFETVNSLYDVYKFTDVDTLNTHTNRCFYLINHDKDLHIFLDHDVLLMYIDIEMVETDMVDGKCNWYTIIYHNLESAPDSMLNPNENHLKEYILTYCEKNKKEIIN